jgi:hypothetical protein
MKRPAFQFYPADWRKDAALQSCSLCSRGLWAEMMCIMHECDPYGTLSVNGRAMGVPQLARLVGEPEKGVKKLLQELEDAGVFSRDSDGRIFSRRMVKDERIRNVRAEGGKAGAEHGAKGAEFGKKGGRPPKDKGGLKTPLTDGENPPPSSSSSSSTTNPSVTDVTDADASPPEKPEGGEEIPGLTAEEAIFKIAVPWLVERGVPDKNARSLMGAARKQLKDEGAWELAQQFMREKPVEPAAWISAAINSRMKPKSKANKHGGFGNQDYREGVGDDGSF